jgi:hypothetical protein
LVGRVIFCKTIIAPAAVHQLRTFANPDSKTIDSVIHKH